MVASRPEAPSPSGRVHSRFCSLPRATTFVACIAYQSCVCGGEKALPCAATVEIAQPDHDSLKVTVYYNDKALRDRLSGLEVSYRS